MVASSVRPSTLSLTPHFATIHVQESLNGQARVAISDEFHYPKKDHHYFYKQAASWNSKGKNNSPYERPRVKY